MKSWLILLLITLSSIILVFNNLSGQGTGLDFNGPENHLHFPGAKNLIKSFSSGIQEISSYYQDGNWHYRKTLLDDGSMVGYRSWKYNASLKSADIFLIEQETKDTIILAKKEFDSEGRVLSHISLTRYYSDSTFNYEYENGKLHSKTIKSSEKREYYEYTFKNGLVDSVYIHDLIDTDTLIKKYQNFIWYENGNYLKKTTNLINTEGINFSSELYNSLGIKIKDLTIYDNFYHAFQWPDTSVFSRLEKVDTLAIGDTLRLRGRFNTGSRDFLITRGDQNEIVFFGHYIPGTSYGTTTFIEEQNDGRLKKHGQFRLNSEKDTVWVGVHVLRFDQRDRLRNRLVYKGKESAENLIRDVLFTYTDTSVTSIREYYDEKIGVNYKHTVERPNLFSNYTYLEKKEKWDPVYEAWEVYFEIKREYDNNWQEIYFSDLNKEIIRKFNNDAVCLEEQILYSDGRLPEGWWMEIEYWPK